MYKRDNRLVTNKFFEFFIPTILMSAAGSLSIIIDSIIVGNVLGSSELAAMNLVMPLSMCITTISCLFGIGGSTTISALKGKMEHKNADKVFTAIITGWILLSIVSIFVSMFFGHSIAVFFSGGSEFTGLVEEYSKVYVAGAPFSFAMFIFPQILKADGKPKIGSNALIISNLVNLCMDIVYMKYMNMGLAGGALATITGYVVGFAICLSYMKSPLRTLHLTKIRIRDFSCYRDMFNCSISSIFGQGFMFGKMLILNMIISSIVGKSGLVAFSVCMSCLSFVSLFISGAAQTMMPLAASFSACGDTASLKATINKSMMIILQCCLGATILFFLIPGVIMKLYGITSPDEVAMGVSAIRIFSISFIGIGFTFFFMYYMQTVQKSTFSLQICALEGFLVIVPMAFIMGNLVGIKGIWISYILNEIVSFLFIFIKSRLIVKKSKGMLHSLFLFKTDIQDKYEATIDIRNDTQIIGITSNMGDFMLDKSSISNIERITLLTRNCINLLQYTTMDTKKISSVVDMTIANRNGTCIVELKSAGKPLSLMKHELKIQECIECLEKNSDQFEYSLLLGMNYIKVSCSG